MSPDLLTEAHPGAAQPKAGAGRAGEGRLSRADPVGDRRPGSHRPRGAGLAWELLPRLASSTPTSSRRCTVLSALRDLATSGEL